MRFIGLLITLIMVWLIGYLAGWVFMMVMDILR